jgi:hypothetical protein
MSELITDPTVRRLIGKARLLRRQGKSYDEIRAVVGPVRSEALARWLKGIARPPETRRGKALDELRARCRALRAEGLTYDEIRDLTGASVGSLSLWLSDMPAGADAAARRAARYRATCERTRAVRLAVRESAIAQASDEIGPVTERELFLAGLSLYWAEGSKSKPWRINDRLVFINSDPTIIAVFMRWLELVGVAPDGCHFHVSIHETANVAAAEEYWARVLGVSASTFNRPTIKRHRPTTVRCNTGDSYQGCLVVDVLKSAQLYRQVEGWWRGLATAGRMT